MSPFLPPPTPNSRSSAPPRPATPPPPPPLLQLQKRERGRGKRCGRKEGRKECNKTISLPSLSLSLSAFLTPPLSPRLGSVDEEKTATKQQLHQNPTTVRAFVSFHALPCQADGLGCAGLASPQRKQQRRRTIFFPSSHAQKPTAVRCADRRPKIRHEVPPGSFRQAPVELHGACCVCPLCTTCQPVLRR